MRWLRRRDARPFTDPYAEYLEALSRIGRHWA